MTGRSVMLAALLVAHLPATDIRAEAEMLRHAFLPSPENVHGETRLLTADGAARLEVILHSASFRRGVREILQREADVWALKPEGYEDSLRFREALTAAKDAVVGIDAPTSADAPGGPFTLLITYRFHPGDCSIRFSRAEVMREDDTFVIRSAEPIADLRVTDAYMSRAMRILSAAAFGLHGESLAELLASAGWHDLSPELDLNAPARR